MTDEATLPVSRGDEVLQQLDAMSVLKRELLERLASCFPLASDAEDSDAHGLINTIELSAESFDLEFDWVPLATVDRRTSMISGPFFTSDEYPIPATGSGMMCPVVQLDLRSASAASGDDLGDGLLQFWYDTSDSYPSEGHIRVIPRDAIEGQAPTAFDWTAPSDLDESSLPVELWFQRDQETVKIIRGLVSTGLRSQHSSIDVHWGELDDQFTDEIRERLQAFREGTEYTNSMHLLGTFYPIQYSASDVGMKCLFHFPRWGSDGNAQLFYEVCGPDSFVFSFRESVR